MPSLHWLDDDNPNWFPPTSTALAHPDGLLAAGGDLSPERLLAAYRRGIFPWFEDGQPILWWTPDPRFVLRPSELRVSRSLRKRIREGRYEVRVDTAFADVIRACAAPREGQNGTWITRSMFAAYTRLHDLGFAHSVEAWENDQLAGGLYGIALGRVFFGESMFHRATDASKVAFAWLCGRLEQCGFDLIDCQVETPHLASLGAVPMAREAFEACLADSVDRDPAGSPWSHA